MVFWSLEVFTCYKLVDVLFIYGSRLELRSLLFLNTPKHVFKGVHNPGAVRVKDFFKKNYWID